MLELLNQIRRHILESVMINMDLTQEKLNTTRHPLVKGNVRTVRNVKGELNLNTAGYTVKLCYKLKKFITI